MTTSPLPVSLRPAKSEVSPAARRTAATDQDDDGKKAAFDDLLHDAGATEQSKKAVAKEANYGDIMRAKAARDRADDGTTAAMRAAGETARDLPPPPLLVWTASANQSASNLPPPPPPDSVDAPAGEASALEGSGGTNPTVVSGFADRKPATGGPFPGEPYAPPPDPMDEVPSDPSATGPAPKTSPIRPHGSPISAPGQAGDQIAVAEVARNGANQTEPLKAPIAPHGPPPSPSDDPLVPLSVTGSSGKIAEPVSSPPEPGVVSGPPSDRVSGDVKQPTDVPIFPTRSQELTHAGGANPVVAANSQVAVSSTAQIPVVVGAAVAVVEKETAAETSPLATPGSASLAPRIEKTNSKDKTIRADQSSQVTHNKQLRQHTILDGTAAAKSPTKMTASQTTTGPIESWGNQREQEAALTSGVPNHSTGRGQAEKAALSLPADGGRPSPSVTLDLSSHFPVSGTPASGIVEVDKVESLLQTVQQTAEKIRLDGHGQLELRVRLNGVADDVTVRLQVDGDKHPQVSFHTASPELRQALERGWNDLVSTAPTSTSGPVVGEARFVPASSSDSSNSLNSPAKPRPGLGPITAPAGPTDVWRRDRTHPTTDADPEKTDATQPSRRWSGWA